MMILRHETIVSKRVLDFKKFLFDCFFNMKYLLLHTNDNDEVQAVLKVLSVKRRNITTY